MKEKTDAETMCSNYLIYDTNMEEQLSEIDVLKRNMKSAIDDEINEKMKNPFCVLPT
jgi:hypothetical protein